MSFKAELSGFRKKTFGHDERKRQRKGYAKYSGVSTFVLELSKNKWSGEGRFGPQRGADYKSRAKKA